MDGPFYRCVIGYRVTRGAEAGRSKITEIWQDRIETKVFVDRNAHEKTGGKCIRGIPWLYAPRNTAGISSYYFALSDRVALGVSVLKSISPMTDRGCVVILGAP